jgi:hypothetical protein
MSNTSVTYLGYIAPEYGHIDAERFAALKSIAETFIDEKVFGNTTSYAVALYIAHMLKLGERTGNGAVTSERVGDISRTYDSGTRGLGETSYGRLFLEVRRSRILPII